jgi:hypothetical protein
LRLEMKMVVVNLVNLLKLEESLLVQQDKRLMS